MVQLVLDALRELRDESEPILIEIAEIFEKMGDRIAEAIKKIEKEIKKLIKKLEDLKRAAEDAANAMRDAGIMGESPSLLELSFAGAAKELGRLRQEMGFLGRGWGGLGSDALAFQRVLNISPVMRPAMVPAGSQAREVHNHFYEGAFAFAGGAFPSVRGGRDAVDFLQELNRLTGNAAARASVPGGS